MTIITITMTTIITMPALAGLSESSKEYQDAHERAHATDIQRRFAGKGHQRPNITVRSDRRVNPWSCGHYGTVICIQLKAFTLGATMVLCFSLGLAITLVTVGVGAAISVQQAAKRWSGLTRWHAKRPIFPACSSRWSAYIWGFTAIWGSSVNIWERSSDSRCA
jgi:ABC-type nickel/cobalt efflux system permease component RcnA